MVEERAKRKLSAILSADVKGNSRLKGRYDEAIAVRKEVLHRNPTYVRSD